MTTSTPPTRTRTARRARSSSAVHAVGVAVVDASGGDLGRRERTEDTEQVGDALEVAGLALGDEALQLGLDRVDDVGVEEIAQLGPAEQLAEQRGVECERGRPALGQWRVALVDERRDIAEQQ